MATSGLHPYIEIVHQPAASHAMENNEDSPNKNKVMNDLQKNKKKNQNMVPRIRINDSQKRGGQLVVTCVNINPNMDMKYHVHSNKLAGKYCRSGVGVYQFQPGDEFVNIEDLYIKIIPREKIQESKENLARLKIDPFKAGYELSNNLINPDQLRLAFQAFLRDKVTPQDIKKMVFTAPIVSNIIYNNSGAAIKIDYIDNASDCVTGGGNILLLIENLKTYYDQNSAKKQELKIRFFDSKWSVFATDCTIYNSSAILITVPPYCNLSTEKDVYVSIQVLVLEGNKEITSDVHVFTYKPSIKPSKRPIAYDDYYECEVQDSKNSVEISKVTRQKLAKRTKKIWSLDKVENWNNLTIDLKLLTERSDEYTMDLIGNNFLINYSNTDNKHFLKPVLDSDDTEKMDVDEELVKNSLLQKIVSTNINENKRIKHPSDAVVNEPSDENVDGYSTAASISLKNENYLENSLIYYNIEEIIDLFD
jgi:hypothetical protein